MNDCSPYREPPLVFIDLKAQQARIRDRIDRAIARVLEQGDYIMGAEVRAFETQLADFAGASHAIGCANGTDALLMALMALGVGRGDAVICPAFTFTATPEVIALLGATPIFADVREDSFNLDPDKLPAAVAAATKAGLAPKAVIAVDLFGLPSDYPRIDSFAAAHRMFVIADAAQGFGGALEGRKVGTFGCVTATSFFPAKPLGCYGDGGALLTNDDALREVLDSIRVHGKGADKYDNVRIGLNSRLDTLQAAILIEKIAIFADEIEARQAAADRYEALLAGTPGIATPQTPRNARSAWAQYTLRVDAPARDALAQSLREAGVPTAVYYPKPLHWQTAYRDFPCATDGLACSERLASEVLSLPMHPYLTAAQQEHVAAAIRAAMKSLAG